MESQSLIQVASISYDGGVVHLAATTDAGIYKEIADFCSKYPEDAGDQAGFHAALEQGDTMAIVEAYFDGNCSEFLDIGFSVKLGT